MSVLSIHVRTIAVVVGVAVALIATRSLFAAPLAPHERVLLDSFGPWPQPVPADPGNELSGLAWAEALGERLFADPLLSGDEQFSCASCHKAELAFTDGIPLAVATGVHVRNTQGLLDIAQQRWFGWDGGADSLWAASLRPILAKVELNGDIPTVAERLRARPEVMSTLRQWGDVPADDEALVVLASKAIGAYLRTLESGRTPFDEYRDAVVAGTDSASDYPADARRGLSIFFGDANCSVCHFGPNFSNREFHDTGRPFFTGVGEVDPGRYTGIQRLRSDPYNLLGGFSVDVSAHDERKTRTVTLDQNNFGQWRTPSLRNLAYTAPYTHDGSLATLRDVVDAYADIDPERIHGNGEALIRPLDLSEQQREDLVAFLKTLSVESLP